MIFMISVAVLGLGYYWAKVVAPTEDIKRQVEREARLYSQIYIVDGEERARAALEERARIRSERDPFHALLRADGTPATANLPTWPLYNGVRWRTIEADIYYQGYELDHAPLVRDIRFKDGARLIIGRDTEDLTEITEFLQNSIQWVVGGTVLLGLLGGLLMSRAIGNRLDAVNRAARRVMDGDLSGRVKLQGSGDDFDQLGETLNAMLERIEELIGGVRRVSDHVAHELRTPLARLSVQLEQLVDGRHSTEELRDLHNSAYREAQHVDAILSALQRISRVETGRYELDKVELDLDVLLSDVVDAYRPVAEARGVRIAVDAKSGIMIHADKALAMQALANIVDNAVKFARVDSVVQLSVTRTHTELRLIVDNAGSTIEHADLARIGERFFRGANALTVSGDGLGLSLVAAIARIHGWRFEIGNLPDGVRASLVLKPSAT